MVTPIDVSYSGPKPIKGGRAASVVGPAWLAAAGAALNKAVVIPGIDGGGVGARMLDWGGIAVLAGRIFTVAQSGHGNYENPFNRANLLADSPVWETVTPMSQFSAITPDALQHNSDGSLVAVHTYDYVQGDPITNRIIRLGGFGTYPHGNGLEASDIIDPMNGALSTAPFISGIGYANCIDTLRGRIWTNGLRCFDTTLNDYIAPNLTGVLENSIPARYPQVYDSVHDRIFSLMWGDGGPSGISNVLNAAVFPAAGGVRQAVTVDASAARTQFLAEYVNGDQAGMTYDRFNDCFYWYAGQRTSRGNLWVIRFTSATTVSVSLFAFAAGSIPLDATPDSGAGINGRVKMIDELKGFIINPSGDGRWFYIETAV